jgi:hypothetical protein
MRQGLERATKPSLVRTLWEGWKRVAKRIGDVQARIRLILFYCIIFAPFALVVRWGTDPLSLKTGMHWRSRDGATGSPMEHASRQF